jgi:hypothetical protein
LDCAENNLKELDLSNLTKLNFVSCRANRLFVDSLKKLKLTNCVSLEWLDVVLQHDLTVSDLQDCQNLKELYCSSDVFSYENISGLNYFELFKAKVFKESLWNKNVSAYEIIENKKVDLLAFRNTKKIQDILTNPNNYSFEDILSLQKKDFHGVPNDLRGQLAELMAKKWKERFVDESYHSGNEEEKPSSEQKDLTFPSNPSPEDGSEISTSTKVPVSQEEPSAPTENENKDKIILALQQKIAELETKIKELENDKNNDKKREEIRSEILNSNLSEEQKQKLLQLLENTKTASEKQPSANSTNYLPYIFSGFIILFVISTLWIGLWFEKKNRRLLRKLEKSKR